MYNDSCEMMTETASEQISENVELQTVKKFDDCMVTLRPQYV